jgi:hypothetical protein
MSYFGIAPAPPRVAELWPKIATRLASVRMNTILGGSGRIKMIGDDLTPLGALTTAWGRVVIAPVRSAFGEAESQPGRRKSVSFLVRSEFNHPGGAYNVGVPNEAAQGEAFALLHGFIPTGMTYARAVEPIVSRVHPQASPLWDQESGLWFLSSEYTVVLAPV